MNRILGYSFDPPPEGDAPTVEEYVDLLSDLIRHERMTRPRLGTMVGDARGSLVLTGRIVAAVQILRDSGALDSAVAFFLIAFYVEWGLGEFADKDPALRAAGHRMREIERTHGRDPTNPDEHFLLDEAPAEWLACNDDWDRRALELEIGLLRALGEPAMASLRELRPEEYHTRRAKGRALLSSH